MPSSRKFRNVIRGYGNAFGNGRLRSCPTSFYIFPETVARRSSSPGFIVFVNMLTLRLIYPQFFSTWIANTSQC